MKKILIYTLLSLTIFSGCKKDNTDLIDGKKPEERVIEALTKYSDQLTGSTYGWKAFLYPDGGGGYSFYLKFDKKNRVTMLSDIDYDPAMTSMESSYRLKANQIPSLLFDTYNYMHVLADPDPNTFGGTPGWGYYSDFEFSFDKEIGDTIKLNGKLLDSKLVLVKATQAEEEGYQNEGLFSTVAYAVDYFSKHSFVYIAFEDANKIQVTFDNNNKIFTMSWQDNGVIRTQSAAFSYTLTGMQLQNPLFYKDKKITDFTEDVVKGSYYTTVNGKRVDITVSATPILPLNALIGVSYTSITLPNATSFPGWSANFIARRAAVANATANGPYRLRLDRMAFSFNTLNKTMNLTAYIFQNSSQFVGVFPYTYTKTAAGVYKFTAGSPTGNASLIVNEFAPLTTQRLDTDQFVLDYFINPANGQILGQFISVEHPDFTFSGTLQ